MSKALRYLAEARPEAMDAYFSFLRANGSRLDPKTRALISIITKVVNQTDSGLRQYAKKAVEQGVSSDEILDALMMAFPALGLSKIVWAVDILIECGVLPETIEAESDGAAWHDIASTQVTSGVHVVECADRTVFLVNNDGQWRVFDAKCPHNGTSLAFCSVDDGQVECPLHGWRFDLNTGTCIRFGTQDLQQFETRIENARVLARW